MTAAFLGTGQVLLLDEAPWGAVKSFREVISFTFALIIECTIYEGRRKDVASGRYRADGPIPPSTEEAVKGWEHRAPPCQNEEPPPLLPDIEFEGE
jgi:hypothetical protein